MEGILSNKRIIVMGVANKRSIAWGCAQEMEKQGATVIYTYQNERMKKSVSRLVNDEQRLIECDVANDDSIQTAFKAIKKRFGKVDGLVHAIAYAKKEELSGSILNVSREGYALAQNVSAYSLIAVAKAAHELDLLNDPASIATLTYFGSERAIPNYNVMGVAKAALEASVRYLARDMGSMGVRVNAISAGAMKTLAVTGIDNHSDLLKMSQDRTTDGQSVTLEEIGGTCAFLMSDLSKGIAGDVIYVDKGVHLI
ncbi:enoyl-ACP reductase FabI [Limosilactobacillus mucosae]|uniref:Enoyl-[acyl-carrier-protein] reductase [NADH] n=1 Tax=Limosilactobacillus mucosae TaxID=97478 RepID=A0AAJ1M8I2_LIMMU|nr:enoyl-ACP reductase FabI [Limosilactobacillus mucosae]MDC2829287.1 enoyl-ACP reductase FabI [Limosilactobacillus mucosae]MDC2836970.1 enoyl-ACP reductase FabI [Limosilactobacillus mucosae]MDC2839057.1 enoyl-ACP reductase FabI [Limosilactobacillus mucosae]MDC2841488.1 enoyl-ACP reductase FabI [Limosilactobacillus mucosae]MDC2845432.1 enoyl-ACP reductase FabI [Limosilactobacillus mucosae]